MNEAFQRTIVQEAEKVALHGEVACVDAHDLAQRLGVTPQEVGAALNKESGLRFYRCQLGLFGYGLKSEGKSKIVTRAANVPDDIRQAIESHAHDGRISCADVWAIADGAKYPRLGMANIVEAMGLRVSPCQLGCF